MPSPPNTASERSGVLQNRSRKKTLSLTDHHFSEFSVHRNHLGILLILRVRSGSELSDDCLGGANAAGPWPTFGGRYWSISKQDLFSSPSVSLTNWPTEQSELPGVEIETLKS